nr:MAG TPA: hypothetical protein [Caudoviricetes sp.]
MRFHARPYFLLMSGERPYLSYCFFAGARCASQYCPSHRFGQPGNEHGFFGFVGNDWPPFRKDRSPHGISPVKAPVSFLFRMISISYCGCCTVLHLLQVSDDNRIFGNFDMGQCLAVPPEGGRSVRTHQVADFLKGIVEKAAVTENGLLVPVGKFFDDRPNLPFEVYETVNFHIDMALQIHDFDKTPYKRRICRTGTSGLFLPGRGGYTACHLTKPCNFLKICVDALVKTVCLTEIFFCRHAETSFRILSMIYSPSRAVRLLYHAERKNASNSASSASGVSVLRYRRR